jgi:transposase-like protein
MSRSKDERAGHYIPVDKLAQRFGSVRQLNKWLSKFKDRKHQQGESISALEDE